MPIGQLFAVLQNKFVWHPEGHRRVLSLSQLGKLINAAADPPKISQLDLNDALKTLKHHEIIQ